MKAEERTEIFETVKADFIRRGYTAEEKTISVLKANVMAFVTAGPVAVIFGIIYGALVPWKDIEFSLSASLWLLGAFAASVFVHEWLHGLGWGLFCRDKSSISYGVMWKMLTPYCSCSEPLRTGAYAFGGLMPFMVLGIGLFAVSLAVQSRFLLYTSLINILSAGGDTTIALMLPKYKNAYIIDHPTQCGFVALTKNPKVHIDKI